MIEKGDMQYVLITKMGKVMTFGVKDCAELYRTINGGFIVQADEKVLDNNSEMLYTNTIDNVKDL